MTMFPVQSKAVTAIGYDSNSQTLRIRYASGAHYEASGVTPEEHAQLVQSDSIGRHLNSNFRSRLKAA